MIDRARVSVAFAMLFVCLCPSSAQSSPESDDGVVQPLPAPPGLALTLETKKGSTQFHFGQKIELKIGLKASVPGFVYAPEHHLRAGHSFQFQCNPEHSVIDRRKNDGRLSPDKILYSGERCGRGGGIGGGGCGDCDEETPLTPKPLTFEITLNREIQFQQPGRYSCTVTDAQVAVASRRREKRTAIELVSAPVELDITEDPTWEDSTFASTLPQVRRDCSRDSRGSKCLEAIETLRFLDTEDSLAALVQHFRGDEKAWLDEIWLGILQTRHRQLLRELLEKKLVDPDFQVTKDFLNTLVALKLEEENPGALADPITEGTTSVFRKSTLRILREYVRALGAALQKKRGKAQIVSAASYLSEASDVFCGDSPLIPEVERTRMLAGLSLPMSP